MIGSIAHSAIAMQAWPHSHIYNGTDVAVQWFAPGAGRPGVGVLRAEDDEDAGKGLRDYGGEYGLRSGEGMLAPGFCGAAFRALAWIGSGTWGYATLQPRLSPAALSEPVVFGRSFGAGPWRNPCEGPGVTLGFSPGYLRRLFQSRLFSAVLSEPGCGVIRAKDLG